MATLSEMVAPIVSGIMTGAASVSTILLKVKNLRKRINDVDNRVSSLEETITRLESSLNLGGWTPPAQVTIVEDGKLEARVSVLEKKTVNIESEIESLKKFKHKVESWDVDPPMWVKKATRDSHHSIDESLAEYDDKIENLKSRIKNLNNKISDLEETSPISSSVFVTKKEYEEDSTKRVEKLESIIKTISSLEGMIRGLYSLLNK